MINTIHVHADEGTKVKTDHGDASKNGWFGFEDDNGNAVAIFAPHDPENAVDFYHELIDVLVMLRNTALHNYDEQRGTKS